MILFSALYLANTSLTYIHAISSAEIFFVYTIKYPHLVSLSTMTRIMSYICPVTRFFNFGNFIIKSYNMTSYSLLGVSTSYSPLYSLCLLNLFLWQSGYSFMIFLAKFYIFLIMYSSCNLNINTITLLCPYISPLWNSLINFFVMFFRIYIAFS